jgi:hypothetical protein
MDIKLKYNERRRGIWFVEPILSKELPKGLYMDYRIGYFNEDMRRIMGRLVNSDYKEFIEVGTNLYVETLAGIVFKAKTILGNSEVYIHLASTSGNMVRASLFVDRQNLNDSIAKGETGERDGRILYRLLLDLLKQELQDIKPVPFVYKVDWHDKTYGIEIRKMERSGELRMYMHEGDEEYSDDLVGDRWRL